ncbi:DUF4118 domain-containing protein [Fulvimarina endophytica]|uniref:histidine kinase n=1 Tax=Fulvimarina endophytica TaxID=2293836 RepID=A0A371X502_9HYPH|nr:HWE histidine kinase domain-containing protein [Fulvimarina endophytica]RFC64289.1 DUF4118 domain-containing protein [Fulvimarina endophytica]
MRLFERAEAVRASAPLRWGLAAGAFAVALATRFAVDHLLPAGFPYLTFFPAVILTTFFAGTRPGLACAAACGLSAWFWFIAPFESFAVNPFVLVALGFYVCIIWVDVVLIHVLHAAVIELKEEKVRSNALLESQKLLLADQKERERQRRILQRELSHRMKNTLAMVQAVVSQSLRNASDPAKAAELASARIMALARAQDALTATSWSAAEVVDIVEASVAPHDEGGRFEISGPSVRLEAQRSLGLALAIHELATNATKYGALSNTSGFVSIRWDLSGSDGFRFVWAESGGPAIGEPPRSGFGSRLTLRVVPNYFAGSAIADYARDGLTYTLTGTRGSPEAEESGH